MHRKWLCIPAAIACLFSQVATARNIFLTSGDYSNPIVATYSSDPLTFGTNIGGLGGAFTVLPSGSVNKYYAISKSATDTVTVLEGRFPNLTVGRKIAIAENMVAAAISPNGQRLLVVGPGGVQIINTETDSSTVTLGGLDVGGDAIDVAVSVDSTRAFVLSAATSRLTAIDLATSRIVGSLQVATSPTAVAVGPNGVVYVSAQGAIYEINGATMTARATIPVTGQPGKLMFTPDGAFGLAVNKAQFSTRAAYLINLTKRTVSDVAGTGVSFTKVAIVDNRTAYAVASGQLYVLNIGADGSLGYAQATFTGQVINGATDVVTTGELPRARFLLIGTASAIYRVDLADNTLSGDYAATTFPGNLTSVAPPNPGGVANIFSYNTTQTVAAGTTSLPIVVRAYDQNGYPVQGVAVTFATTTSGVSLASATATTNFQGYASTTVAIPASMTSGTVKVTATAGGSRSAEYTITIGDPGLNPGGGTTTPPPRSGLQIYSGHGQAIGENFTTEQNLDPIAIKLTDKNGNPVPNAEIRWRLVQGSGSVLQSTFTDSNGISAGRFTSTSIPPGIPYVTNVVAATSVSTNEEVSFYITTLPRGSVGSFGALSAVLVKPADKTIQARAGETIRDAIQVQVSSLASSQPIPYIGMRLIPSGMDPSYTATAECEGGTALSNNSGLVTCDLVVGRNLGTASFKMLVGSQVTFDNFSIVVGPGEAAKIILTNGERRSGNPGEQVSPLNIQVQDAAGHALANVPVTWGFPDDVSVINYQRFTDASGNASATIRLGQRGGTQMLRVSAGNASASFTIITNISGAGLQKQDGSDAQTAMVGQQFAQPVRVKVVDANGQPVANATVTFTVTGPATLGQASVTSGADGIAGTTVTAGSTPGSVVVTAASGNATATFNLVVTGPGPMFTAADVLDAAGMQPGVAPGSMAFIRVKNAAPSVQGSTSAPSVGQFPMQLAGVEVLINNTAVPISSVSNVAGQEGIVVQVPFEVPTGTASVTVRGATGTSTTVNNVQILPVKPGVYTYRDASGATFALATRPDGSLVTSTNPVRRGEIIRVYATGLGQTTPAATTNRQGVDGMRVAAELVAGVNDQGNRIVAAEMLSGSIGEYYVAIEIPMDTTAGPNQPFGLGAVAPDGSTVFANSTALPIQ